uniref:General odorant-binding protein 70 n=1 Tax=Cacopsylla melanoneura TaxID=428564 RepID=A0A8D8R0C7_9HEMI
MFYKIKMDYQYIFLVCCVVYLSQVSCQIQHRQQHAQPKQAAESRKYSKCEPPTTAPQKLEKIIGQCQDEIKQALLQEALEVIDDVKHQIGNKQNHKQHQNSNNDNKAAAFVPHTRTKRENFSGEERRVAGCLLQCVYRKVKAVDANNFPSAEGLVRLYSEGVQDRNYFTATYQSVQFCMKLAEQVRQSKPNGVLDGGQTCDLAYDMFNCVSDQIEKFCEVPA